MGRIKDNVKKNFERQKNGLIKEANKAGLVVQELIETGDETDSAKKAISSSLKAVIGGRFATDNVQVLRFDNNYCYIQPYSGITCLPGEHYCILDGSFEKALILEKTIFGGLKWNADNDKDLTKKINKDYPQLKKLGKKCKTKWTIGTGEIKLKWVVQLLSIGEGKSLLIMNAGRYGGFTSYEVGFSHFQPIKKEIQALLSQMTVPRHEPLKTPSYSSIAMETLYGA